MTRVVIIGGGIGGLTAANALSRAGIEVTVCEAAAELKEIGAGVALHPNAMKVLHAIGVEANVRKVAGQSQWQVMRNWKTGRVIAKTSRQQQAASFGTEGATVHRADLLDVLAARERGRSNHLTSPWAAWRRDLTIAWRRRVNRRDPEGRGAAWLADYDASSPDVLAA